MKLSDKVYNVLKRIATIVLPAIGTFYFTLSGIWGFPYGEQIIGTITAADTCLGILIGISTSTYNKQVTANADSEHK
ncbi:MAG: phage holin [Butyrivibrio sp.]